MKIGLFTDRYLPLTDGITTSVETFRVELEKLGHEVYVIAPAGGLRLTEANPRVIRFRAVKGLFFEDYATSIFFPPQILRKLGKLDLDIIHYHTPSQVGLLGAYLALHTDIPLVTTYHTDLYEYVTHYPTVLPGIIALSMLGPVITGGGMSEYRSGFSAIKPERSIDKWNQKIVERGVTMIHNHCDLIISPSEKMATMLKSWGTTAPITILPTGIDELKTTNFEMNAARKQYGINESDDVILFVGRIGGEKNVELLLKAFVSVAKKNPHAKLLFIGKGPIREDMIQLAHDQKLGDRISFPGEVDRAKLGAIYRISTIFAFPSLADTQGLVVNEAALAGLPIIMIDPHVSEVVQDHKTGLYAKPTIRDLAAKLVLLLKDPALRLELGTAARKTARMYSAAAQAEKLVSLYQKAILRHEAAPKPKPSKLRLKNKKTR